MLPNKVKKAILNCHFIMLKKTMGIDGRSFGIVMTPTGVRVRVILVNFLLIMQLVLSLKLEVDPQKS
jgi:hypothetical protein